MIFRSKSGHVEYDDKSGRMHVWADDELGQVYRDLDRAQQDAEAILDVIKQVRKAEKAPG